MKKGDRILLGCDGIFDFLSNNDCVAISKSKKNVENATVAILDQSFMCGSADNLTVIINEITELTNIILISKLYQVKSSKFG